MTIFARYLSAVLALAYPWVASIAASRHSSAWAVCAIALLALAVMVPSLVRGRPFAWIALACVAAAIWLLGSLPPYRLLLYVPPVLIPAFIAMGFGRTLLADRVPLIEQFVRSSHPPEEPIEPSVWPYARRLTIAWTVLLSGIAIVNLMLALLVVPEGLLMTAGIRPPLAITQTQWSLFANFIGYVLIGAFFVLEYAYRSRRFRQPYRNFFDFLRRTIAVTPHLVSSGRSMS